MFYRPIGRKWGRVIDVRVISPVKEREGTGSFGETCKVHLNQDFFEEVDFEQSFPEELKCNLRVKG